MRYCIKTSSGFLATDPEADDILLTYPDYVESLYESQPDPGSVPLYAFEESDGDAYTWVDDIDDACALSSPAIACDLAARLADKYCDWVEHPTIHQSSDGSEIATQQHRRHKVSPENDLTVPILNNDRVGATRVQALLDMIKEAGPDSGHGLLFYGKMYNTEVVAVYGNWPGRPDLLDMSAANEHGARSSGQEQGR